VGSRVREPLPSVDLWAPVGIDQLPVDLEDIAEGLGVNPHTTARHVSNACAKLGAANRAEAAAKFEETKIRQ
jgi:hypothetical protein